MELLQTLDTFHLTKNSGLNCWNFQWEMENDFSVDAFASFLPKFKVIDFPKFPKKRITSQSVLKNFFRKSR